MIARKMALQFVRYFLFKNINSKASPKILGQNREAVIKAMPRVKSLRNPSVFQTKYLREIEWHFVVSVSELALQRHSKGFINLKNRIKMKRQRSKFEILKNIFKQAKYNTLLVARTTAPVPSPRKANPRHKVHT